MNKNNAYDIAVIGGGVIGLSLAWRLAQSGATVAVIDAGAVRPGATTAAAGMLAPSFETAPGDAIGAHLFAFGRRSLADWPAFAATLQDAAGLDIDYRADGVIGVALDEGEAAVLTKRSAALQDAGVDCMRMNGEEARKLEPALGPSIVAASFAPSEGEVDPVLLNRALQIAFARVGVTIKGRARHATRRDGVYQIAIATPGGVDCAVLADKLVVAAGAHARAVCAGLDVAPPPVRPVKGEALALVAASGTRAHDGADMPRRVVRSANAYICPKADGRIVIGATEVEGRWDAAPECAAIDRLRAGAALVCPGLGSLSEQARWAGLRPGTPDNAPLLGMPDGGPPGLFFALGAYRNGVLFAPATADVLSGAILGETATADDRAFLAAFAPDRFARADADSDVGADTEADTEAGTEASGALALANS